MPVPPHAIHVRSVRVRSWDLCAGAGRVHVTHYSFLYGISFSYIMCSSFTGETLELRDGRWKKSTLQLYFMHSSGCYVIYIFCWGYKVVHDKGPFPGSDLLQYVIYCRQMGWRTFMADHIASINSSLCYPIESIRTFPLAAWPSIPISGNTDLWSRKNNGVPMPRPYMSGRDTMKKGKFHITVHEVLGLISEYLCGIFLTVFPPPKTKKP